MSCERYWAGGIWAARWALLCQTPGPPPPGPPPGPGPGPPWPCGMGRKWCCAVPEGTGDGGFEAENAAGVVDRELPSETGTQSDERRLDGTDAGDRGPLYKLVRSSQVLWREPSEASQCKLSIMTLRRQ